MCALRFHECVHRCRVARSHTISLLLLQLLALLFEDKFKQLNSDIKRLADRKHSRSCRRPTLKLTFAHTFTFTFTLSLSLSLSLPCCRVCSFACSQCIHTHAHRHTPTPYATPVSTQVSCRSRTARQCLMYRSTYGQTSSLKALFILSQQVTRKHSRTNYIKTLRARTLVCVRAEVDTHTLACMYRKLGAQALQNGPRWCYAGPYKHAHAYTHTHTIARGH